MHIVNFFLRNSLKLTVIFYLIFVLSACQAPSSNIPDQNLSEARVDTQLTLNNAILEQSNKQDNTVWKIKADNIVYSEDQQTAVLDEVIGNLLQNEKIK